MNRRTGILVTVVGSSALALVFSACSGDNSSGDAGDATAPDVVGNDVQQQDTGPGNDSGSDASDGAAVPCVGNDAGCTSCCAALEPDAAAIFLGNVVNCACATPGDCNTNQTCKQNLCNGGAPSANCDVCINDKDAGDCFTASATACLGNPSCAPLVACVLACNSATPTDAGAD